MNFVFISPQFPEGYWQFCAALRRRGVTVLGVGDAPYDQLSDQLQGALTEYFRVGDLADYDQVFRAVAFFSYKYGKVDWIESNNEYWLALDARLRDDFHVTTGPSSAQVQVWQSKALMKPLYVAAGVPSARQALLPPDAPEAAKQAAEALVDEVGYPLFAKPERGVGSGGACKVANKAQLKHLLSQVAEGAVPYVLEEYVQGQIVAYDAILDAAGEPVFENQEVFPPSMEEVVRKQLDLSYLTLPEVEPDLAAAGRATARAFGLRNRLVHMEFFRLVADKPGLANAGELVGLEVNVRPAGGLTPDMMNFAHSTDVYQRWADMVVGDTASAANDDQFKHYVCVYAGRRDAHRYAYSEEDVWKRYGDSVVMSGRIPYVLADDLGNSHFTARFATEREARRFAAYVQKKAR